MSISGQPCPWAWVAAVFLRLWSEYLSTSTPLALRAAAHSLLMRETGIGCRVSMNIHSGSVALSVGTAVILSMIAATGHRGSLGFWGGSRPSSGPFFVSSWPILWLAWPNPDQLRSRPWLGV